MQEEDTAGSAGARQGVGSLPIDHEAVETSLAPPESYTSEGTQLFFTKKRFSHLNPDSSIQTLTPI